MEDEAIPEKGLKVETEHLEESKRPVIEGLIYEDAEHEPQLHWRTYVAMASMCLIQYVQLMALVGPSTAITYIAEDLNGSSRRTWIVNVVTLIQAALGPTISSASDMFQARKYILIGAAAFAVVGSAIAPGSTQIIRLIVAQTLIGIGLAAAPLSYAVPSEILPRKWRPVAQALINTTGSMGAVTAPLIIGAFLRNAPGGWRNFYWIQTGLWIAVIVGLVLGYLPPKRHTRYDHLSFVQKVTSLDLVGAFLLLSGATLFITGLNLGGGGGLFPWTAAQVLAPLTTGIIALIAFGIYEAFGTKTGILHHDLFQQTSRRNFALFSALFFIEGIMFFATAVWYPVLTSALFTVDPLVNAAYFMPAVGPAVLVSMVYGSISTRTKSVRWPLIVGFSIWTGGLIGQSTVQPGQNSIALGTLVLVGIGIAGPLLLILAGVHLSIPPHLMATGSAVVVCSRSFGATIFTAINSVVVGDRLNKLIPSYVASAVLPLGLPPSSLGLFLEDLTMYDFAGLAAVPGASPQIVGAGIAALKQAFADSVRPAFIIAACFGVVACILCACFRSIRNYMDYKVDAPIEELHKKHKDLEQE